MLIAAAAAVLLLLVVLLVPARVEARACLRERGAKAGARLVLFGGLISKRFKESVEYGAGRLPVFSNPETRRYGRNVFDKSAYASKRKMRKKRGANGLVFIKAAARAAKVRSLSVSGRLGIEGAADKTVRIIGSARVFASTAFCLFPKAERRFDVSPVFDKPAVHIDAECIFSFFAGKFILEAIKAKRRQK